MSEAFKDLVARVDAHDVEIDRVRREAVYPALARKTDLDLGERIDRANSVWVVLPLDPFLTQEEADALYAPVSHGSTHLPEGSDPVFARSTDYTVSNDTPNRTLDLATVTGTQLANIVATTLRDGEANKIPGVA